MQRTQSSQREIADSALPSVLAKDWKVSQSGMTVEEQRAERLYTFGDRTASICDVRNPSAAGRHYFRPRRGKAAASDRRSFTAHAVAHSDESNRYVSSSAP